jgi:formylmethanofuran dehydrogenase subunit E
VSDRSLGEFAADGDDADPAPDAAPARATMRWSPDGAPCDACGESVARRWRASAADDDYVCADCKEW